MNYEDVKRIKEKISCPQLGDDHYGEWGILNLNQRIAIKELLDFVDAQENYIKSLQAKIEEVGEVAKKQIPKKLDGKDEDDLVCGCHNCGEVNALWRMNGDRNRYCGNCGQAIDWGDTNEMD